MSSSDPIAHPRRRRKGGRRGKAYLVGAGPGDPGLITVRGMELLGSADAIVFDALANPELLRFATSDGRREVEMHNVGKRGGDVVGSARQEQINELLVSLVRQGKRVVRLKGGDPLVFGRGGEEAQALAEAGLPFEIVPGVTAGIAAPAYAGIPVTHRGLSTSVTFVTGHEDPLKGAPEVDWGALARSNGTIVLYMGVRKLPDVAAALIAGGMSPDIPAAAIEWGTMGRQRTVTATLATLSDVAAAAGIGAPAITVIGWPVFLRDEIAWFDNRPLFGKRVLVTRPADSSGAGKLALILRDAGAHVIEVPLTQIVAIDGNPLVPSILALESYQWVMFTSANAVEFFWKALHDMERDSRALGKLKVAAVGPATAAALQQRGITPDATAIRFAAEGLLDVLRERGDVVGSRVLYPCAEGARATLSTGLEDVGAIVERIHIYRSEQIAGAEQSLLDAFHVDEPDVVAFSAASAVNAFVEAVGVAPLGDVAVASIGPVTSAALTESGVFVDIEADRATLASLADAIADHFESLAPGKADVGDADYDDIDVTSFGDDEDGASDGDEDAIAASEDGS